MHYFYRGLLVIILGFFGLFGHVQAQDGSFFYYDFSEYPGTLISELVIYEMEGEYACDEPAFSGWICQKVKYGHLTGFEFVIRYNLPDATPADHVIWTAGTVVDTVSRNVAGVAALQDEMAKQNVRSYDISMTKVGSLNGIDWGSDEVVYALPNISAILAALTQYVRTEYTGGQKNTLIAYDVTSTLAAYALAFHSLESDIDQLILLGGPAGVNYYRELSEPSFSAYLDPDEEVEGELVRKLVMLQNNWDDVNFCETNTFYIGFFSECCSLDNPTICADRKILDIASIFTQSDAKWTVVDTNYSLKLHSIVGGDSTPWFQNSSAYWLDQVTASVETREVIAGIDHNLYSSYDTRKRILELLGLNTDDLPTDDGVSTSPGLNDTVPPTPPTSITLVDNTSSFGNLLPGSVTVRPSGAIDDIMVLRYEIYRDDEYVGLATAGIPFNDYSVAPNTTYEYTAKAVDAAGNVSTLSVSFPITTASAAPSFPFTPPSPVVNDIPFIQTVDAYQLKSDTAFDKYAFDVLTCIDSQDGDIKASLVVDASSIPAAPVIGGQYLIKLDCTDSDGNVAYQETATVVIVSADTATTDPADPSTPVDPADPTTPPPAPVPVEPNVPGTNPGGLVPCGDEGQPNCQFCHFISLIDNVTQWLVKIMTLIATIAFVWAGVRMATSVGDAAAKQDAKKLIIKVATGLVIVLAAWIFIDFLLQVLIGSGFSGPWNLISCVGQPVVSPSTP